jgi:hypothetical protein
MPSAKKSMPSPMLQADDDSDDDSDDDDDAPAGAIANPLATTGDDGQVSAATMM